MVAQFQNQQPSYPDNVRDTIDWLLSLGRPPLPECPIEAAKQGKEPKAPCFFNGRGVTPINWKHWQSQQPIKEIYSSWFSSPKTGIGSLGGWNGRHWLCWIDIDSKNFSDEEECEHTINQWVEQYSVLAEAPMFRTPNGGYRFLVAFDKEPENFKSNSGFTLDPEGSYHVGELLTKNGGHTLLPPTIGVNGKPYYWVRWKEYPPIVLEPVDIGVYPLQKCTNSKGTTVPFVLPVSSTYSTKTNNSNLSDFLEYEIYPRLTADTAFSWTGHDFTPSGNKLRGNCPWHDSKSGTAFYVDSKDGKYLWRCPACDIGGSVIEYRHRLAGGNGSPRGKDFINIVQQLADDVGVAIPTSDRHRCASKGDSHTKQSSSNNQPSKGDVSSDIYYVGEGTAEELMQHIIFDDLQDKWITINGTFYQYTEKGYWRRVTENIVMKLIAQKLRRAYRLVQRDGQLVKNFPYYTDKCKQSTYRLCRDALDVGTLPNNQHLLCFNNCTVDLRTGEAVPHDPSHMLTTAIAADYEPDQHCPEVFLNFMKSAYGEDLIDEIRAYTSMYLDPTAPYGVFVHLIGASGSGKGTLLRLWGEMFGEEHFRSGEFSNLSTAEGRHQYLTGAALYTVPDVGGYVQGLKSFYELVDNGAMTGRALFNPNAYQKRWNVRFAIGSVDHLQIENSGDGWDRRCRPLPTKNRQGIEDPYLGAKLAEVKAQIISWALAMPRGERDRILLQPSTNDRVLALKHDAAIHGDPVRAFVDLCLRPGGKNQSLMQSHQLHTWFNAFCSQHGYQSWGMSKFINHLKTILPNQYVPRRRALSTEDTDRRMISAHWSGITSLPGVFVDIALQESDRGFPSTQHHEPQWVCVKSTCREGGLLAFKESGSAGSIGSVTTLKVDDPRVMTQYQDFQKDGSVGSPGSGRGVYLAPLTTKEDAIFDALTGGLFELQENRAIPPTPPTDPTDPDDPSAETIENTLLNVDRPHSMVTDPDDPSAETIENTLLNVDRPHSMVTDPLADPLEVDDPSEVKDALESEFAGDNSPSHQDGICQKTETIHSAIATENREVRFKKGDPVVAPSGVGRIECFYSDGSFGVELVDSTLLSHCEAQELTLIKEGLQVRIPINNGFSYRVGTIRAFSNDDTLAYVQYRDKPKEPLKGLHLKLTDIQPLKMS